jgi:hypothetical protein
MGFQVPMTADVMLGIALNRGRRDFTELGRLLLKVIGSHLQQAT